MAERIVVLSPVAQFRKAQRVDMALPDSLSDKVLGILNNNKPNAAVFFDAVAEGLVGGHAVARVVKMTKATPPLPAEPEQLDHLARECDLVLTGTGD